MTLSAHYVRPTYVADEVF